MAIGTALGLVGGLVAPAMQAFGGTPRGVKAFERFLKSRGISDADARKMISDQSGIAGDKAQMAKANIMGNLQAQGLGNSIIGTQAGMEIDKAKNQSIVDTARDIDFKRQDEQMRRQEMLAQMRMQQSLAKRQGRADFFGGLLGGLSKIKGESNVLTNWINRDRG